MVTGCRGMASREPELLQITRYIKQTNKQVKVKVSNVRSPGVTLRPFSAVVQDMVPGAPPRYRQIRLIELFKSYACIDENSLTPRCK